MKYTSALANKTIRSLKEAYNSVLSEEKANYTYTYQMDENPTIVPYDFLETQKTLNAINQKILTLRHAVNVFNTTTVLPELDLTIDQALIKMAMLTEQKNKLFHMKNIRTRRDSYGEKPEFTKANYDTAYVQECYDMVSQELTKLQMALDYANLTETFDVDI